MSLSIGSLRPLFANPRDEDGAQLTVSPERRQQLLRQANQDNGGFLSDLFWALDTPGAVVRGGLVGGLQGAADALTQDATERIDGREVLRHYGLAGSEDNWGNFSAGVAAESLLDPLAYLSGPLKALTGAGRAASKAGLLADAPELLSKAYLRGAGIAPELRSAADTSLRRLGRTAISETEVAGRPLIGRRAAYRYGTLGDLVSAARDPDAARSSVLAALGGDESRYTKLAGEKLGRNFGLSLPLGDPIASFDLPVVGDAFGDAMDAVSSAVRWSPVGRAYNQFTNNAVGQSYDAQSQAMFAGAAKEAERAKAAARGDSAFQAAKLFEQEPDVFSKDGNRALGRLIENPLDNINRQADSVWESSHPAAREYMRWWDETAQRLPDEFEKVGLVGDRFDDPNISGYLPRRTDGALDVAGQRDASLGRVLKTLTPDQLHRSEYLQVPGGRDTLAFDLSQDSFVAGAKRGAKTDAEAAAYIAQKLYGDPSANVKQATHLAQLLHRLPDSVTDPASGVPLFGQHPTQSIMRYVEGRAGAKATQESILDILANGVVGAPADLAEGGRHISLSEALSRMGARSGTSAGAEVGAKQQMRDRLAALLKTEPDKVDLAGLSVPEDLVERLLRVREGYLSPQATQHLVGYLDTYNRVWKNSILSWPSRVNRDLYSGAYSNWLEGAWDVSSVAITRRLMKDSAWSPEFQQWLADIPKYASVAPEQRVARYYADLASTGLLDGSYLADRGRVVDGGPVQDLLVGTTPNTYLGAFRELGSGWGDFFNFEKNPILRYGAKSGNFSDQLNRLTGYNALLKQGVDPAEAARRMKRAHVDYASLTPQERYIRDKIFPFYSYWSRSFQEILRQLAERPGGRYGQGIRLYERAQQGDEDDYTTEALRRQFAAQIDPADPLFGWIAAPEGQAKTYLTDVDLPGYDQLQMFDGSVTGTLRNLAMQAHPGWKALAEAINQQDFFTGTPISAGSRGYGAFSKIARAATGDPDAARGWGAFALDKAVDLTPFASRPARLLAGLVDQDTGVSFPTRAFHAAVTNAGIGKIRDLSEDDLRRDAIEKLQEMAAPYTREISSPYIPESMRPFVPMDAQEALATSRELQREMREIRRRRRELSFGFGD